MEQKPSIRQIIEEADRVIYCAWKEYIRKRDKAIKERDEKINRMEEIDGV